MSIAAAVVFVVQLSAAGGASLDHLSISYHLTGPFGGVGNFVRTRPDARSYSIPLEYEGVAAESLKGIVFSPTARVVLLQWDRKTTAVPKPVSVTLEPQRIVTVTGTIVTPIDPAGLTVDAQYIAPWAMDFFGYLDGPVPTFTLGSVPLEKGGIFRISLPDLSRDPVVRSYDLKGDPSSIELVVRDAKNWNIRYRLQLENGSQILARNPLPETIRCVTR